MRSFPDLLPALVVALFFAVGCGRGSTTPQTGSESHFLTACSASCDQGFACLCGVCTKVCSEDQSCAAIHSGAECVDVASRPEASRCDDTAVPAFCDVRCDTVADCRGLGTDFSCQAGFCRQGSSGVVGTDARVELAEVCDVYVADVCRAKLDCYGWDYASYDACLAAQECDGFADLDAMLAAGSVQYDPVATAACADILAGNACALGTILFAVPTLPEVLRECGELFGHPALVGERAVGEACSKSVECLAGLECDLETTCPSTCRVPPPHDDLPAGAACLPELCIPAQDHCSQCALGLECVNEVCVKTPVVGDSCAAVLDCSSALWCNVTAGQCKPRAKLGEACSDFRQIAPNCEDGLWCDDPPAMPMVTGTCKSPARQGEPCRDDSNCNAPLTCIPTVGGPPLDHGSCGTPLPNGSLCNSFDDCQSDLCATDTCVPQPGLGEACIDTCAEGLVCGNETSSTTCVSKRYAGEPCDAQSACIGSRCLNGACTTRGHFGDACALADDCLSGSCDVTCVDPVGCAG